MQWQTSSRVSRTWSRRLLRQVNYSTPPPSNFEIGRCKSADSSCCPVKCSCLAMSCDAQPRPPPTRRPRRPAATPSRPPSCRSWRLYASSSPPPLPWPTPPASTAWQMCARAHLPYRCVFVHENFVVHASKSAERYLVFLCIGSCSGPSLQVPAEVPPIRGNLQTTQVLYRRYCCSFPSPPPPPQEPFLT